jgi:simple sugar transport system ATP-binding protein
MSLRVAVMRQGRIVGTLPGEAASEAALLGLMFAGLPAPVAPPRQPGPTGATVLELDRVCTPPRDGAVAPRDVSLRFVEGEILGVAGVSGNGQAEMAELIPGERRPRRGGKRSWGENASTCSPAKIRARGTGSIPDDPLALAAIGGLSVRENLALGDSGRYGAGLGIAWRRLRAAIDASAARLRFPPLSYEARAGVLSGGNLQRVVLTRELAHGPKLIVALYPNRGLYTRSAEALRELLRAAGSAGAAILLVSEDLEELFALSDRLVVLRQGRVVETFPPASFQPETVGPSMVGAANVA